ncbi:MAG TPA: type II toxin-antitoxin system death-on-curing family toxin [Candidatus Eremiobacteraceae bacterium]|nr:type II toxin-antitoxin system death-on-curing family toxin [Candidatus Eremiobacteraceae bacterium]
MKEPLWIDERDTLALHGRLLALDGGSPGVRSAALLESALARPRQLYAYGDAPDIIDLAVAYTAAVIRNHPFVDGNKRTGFLVGVLFLEMNGCHFTAEEEDATQAVLGLAAGELDEASFTSWLRANVAASRD